MSEEKQNLVTACLKNLWKEVGETNFKNDVFLIHAYCFCNWDEDDERSCEFCENPNFTFYDYESMDLVLARFDCSWYKHIGRGMMFSNDISVQDILKIFTKCFESIN